MLLFPFLLILNASAQGRSNLYSKPEPKIEKKEEIEKSVTTSKNKTKHNISNVVGNLDSEILVQNSSYVAEGNVVIVPSSIRGIPFSGLRIGEVVRATVTESLIAFPEGKAPIRARISQGDLKGGIFLGDATLEKNSKRILIEFKKFRPDRGQEDYQLTASVLDSKGILGIEGNYISNEPKYFAAEFLAAGAAGYADASIQRSQNALGNFIEAPTADTVGKKALSSALSKTTERFADKIKSAPEYSVLEGPIEVQILITEQPKLIE